MSLINQVLNDLEKRQATDGDQPLLAGNSLQSVPVRRRGFTPLVLLTLVALVAGAGAVAWIKDQKTAAPIAYEVTASPVPPMPDPPAPVQAEPARVSAAASAPHLHFLMNCPGVQLGFAGPLG